MAARVWQGIDRRGPKVLVSVHRALGRAQTQAHSRAQSGRSRAETWPGPYFFPWRLLLARAGLVLCPASLLVVRCVGGTSERAKEDCGRRARTARSIIRGARGDPLAPCLPRGRILSLAAFSLVSTPTARRPSAYLPRSSYHRFHTPPRRHLRTPRPECTPPHSIRHIIESTRMTTVQCCGFRPLISLSRSMPLAGGPRLAQSPTYLFLISEPPPSIHRRNPRHTRIRGTEAAGQLTVLPRPEKSSVVLPMGPWVEVPPVLS